jgi:steroid delta-isomerase-like uncharacterized protein
MRDDIRRLFERRLIAWKDRDPHALSSDYADGATVESPTHGVLATREAIHSVYVTWFEAFPDLLFRQDDLLVDGDRAALFFSARGTHMKAFGGVPPTGRPMDIRGVCLFTLQEDGRIIREKRYYDSTSLLVQIGVLKAKPM